MKDPDTSLRFKRIIIAALLAQLVLIVVLVATLTVYNYLVLPAEIDGSFSGFAARIGPRLNLYVGALATLLMAYWAARKPETNQVLHGLLTGLIVVVIDLAILVTPGSEFSLLTGLAMLLKLAAGFLGGFLAFRHYQRRSLRQPTGHRII